MFEKLCNTDRTRWKVAIIDEEKEIQTITESVLKDLTFDSKPLEFVSASSPEDAKQLLKAHEDIAVILLDIAMGEETAGLELVHYIRNEIGNNQVRIVLRSGEYLCPPENELIEHYEINDYKNKAELSPQRLITTVLTALRGFRDLEKVRQSKTRLDHAKHFLNTILDAISSGIIVLNKDFIVHSHNKIATTIFDVAGEDMVGQKIDAISPIFKENLSQIEKAFQSNQEITIPPMQLEDARWYALHLQPFYYDDFKGLVIRVDDFTQQIIQEEEMRKIEKVETIGTLAAGLIHDFNNILGGIAGAVSLMKLELDDLAEDSLIRDGVSVVSSSVLKASDIIKRLLSVTKSSKSKFVPVELNTLVKSIGELCRKSSDATVHTHIEVQDEDCFVLGDLAQLEQMLLNICINASHAMTIMKSEGEDWGGELTIKVHTILHDDELYRRFETDTEKCYYAIEVHDTGVGISDELLKRIFDPFFTTKKKETGFGFGLSMVYKTITEHEGHVVVHSEMGKGTTFRVYLKCIDGDNHARM